ncbi:unnamed protein product, partial [Iphiclides podalirius]
PATNGQIERAIQTFKKVCHGLGNYLGLYSSKTVPTHLNKNPAELLNGKYSTVVLALDADNGPDRSERQLEVVPMDQKRSGDEPPSSMSKALVV